MENDDLIRRAVRRDNSSLAALKADYIRREYQGFFDKSMLSQLSAASYAQEIDQWLSEDLYVTDVMEIDGKIGGYVIYGPDPDNEGWGLIVDIRAMHPIDASRKSKLVDHTLNELAALGFEHVHIWLVHDNFRLRFLFESMGFRKAGDEREEVQLGQPILMDLYRYHIQQ